MDLQAEVDIHEMPTQEPMPPPPILGKISRASSSNSSSRRSMPKLDIRITCSKSPGQKSSIQDLDTQAPEVDAPERDEDNIQDLDTQASDFTWHSNKKKSDEDNNIQELDTQAFDSPRPRKSIQRRSIHDLDTQQNFGADVDGIEDMDTQPPDFTPSCIKKKPSPLFNSPKVRNKRLLTNKNIQELETQASDYNDEEESQVRSSYQRKPPMAASDSLKVNYVPDSDGESEEDIVERTPSPKNRTTRAPVNIDITEAAGGTSSVVEPRNLLPLLAEEELPDKTDNGTMNLERERSKSPVPTSEKQSDSLVENSQNETPKSKARGNTRKRRVSGAAIPEVEDATEEPKVEEDSIGTSLRKVFGGESQRDGRTTPEEFSTQQLRNIMGTPTTSEKSLRNETPEVSRMQDVNSHLDQMFGNDKNDSPKPEMENFVASTQEVLGALEMTQLESPKTSAKDKHVTTTQSEDKLESESSRGDPVVSNLDKMFGDEINDGGDLQPDEPFDCTQQLESALSSQKAMSPPKSLRVPKAKTAAQDKIETAKASHDDTLTSNLNDLFGEDKVENNNNNADMDNSVLSTQQVIECLQPAPKDPELPGPSTEEKSSASESRGRRSSRRGESAAKLPSYLDNYDVTTPAKRTRRSEKQLAGTKSPTRKSTREKTAAESPRKRQKVESPAREATAKRQPKVDLSKSLVVETASTSRGRGKRGNNSASESDSSSKDDVSSDAKLSDDSPVRKSSPVVVESNQLLVLNHECDLSDKEKEQLFKSMHQSDEDYLSEFNDFLNAPDDKSPTTATTGVDSDDEFASHLFVDWGTSAFDEELDLTPPQTSNSPVVKSVENDCSRESVFQKPKAPRGRRPTRKNEQASDFKTPEKVIMTKNCCVVLIPCDSMREPLTNNCCNVLKAPSVKQEESPSTSSGTKKGSRRGSKVLNNTICAIPKRQRGRNDSTSEERPPKQPKIKEDFAAGTSVKAPAAPRGRPRKNSKSHDSTAVVEPGTPETAKENNSPQQRLTRRQTAYRVLFTSMATEGYPEEIKRLGLSLIIFIYLNYFFSHLNCR